MLITLSALAFLMQIVAAGPRVSKRDGWNTITWQEFGPTGVSSPANPFDAREPGVNNVSWFQLIDGGQAAGLNAGSMVGWRLEADHGNAVVFKMADMTHTPLLATNYTGSQSENRKPASMEHYANVGLANFQPSNSSNSVQNDDIWTNSSGYQTLGWDISVMIFNGCDTKGDFLVSTIDANGTKQTYNGTANNTLGPWKQNWALHFL